MPQIIRNDHYQYGEEFSKLQSFHQVSNAGEIIYKRVTLQQFANENEKTLEKIKTVYTSVLRARLQYTTSLKFKVKLNDRKLNGILGGKRYMVFTSGDGNEDDGCVYDSHLDDLAEETVDMFRNTTDQSFMLVELPSNHYSESQGIRAEHKEKMRTTQFQTFCEIFPRLDNSDANRYEISVSNKHQLFEQTREFIVNDEIAQRSLQRIIIINGHGLPSGLEFKDGNEAVPLDKYCAFIQHCIAEVYNGNGPNVLLIFAQCYGHLFDPQFDEKEKETLRVFSLSFDSHPTVHYDLYDPSGVCVGAITLS